MAGYGENDKLIESNTVKGAYGKNDTLVDTSGKEQGKGFLGHAKDTGVSLLKGAVAVPEAVVGLADIPTGGRVGKFLENEGGVLGFRPKD